MRQLWQIEFCGKCVARMRDWLDREGIPPTSYVLEDNIFRTVAPDVFERFIAQFPQCCKHGDVALVPLVKILRQGMLPGDA